MTNKDIEDKILDFAFENGAVSDLTDTPQTKQIIQIRVDKLADFISQLENAARKDQTFKTIQILVKAGSISDRAASLTLATLLATLNKENKK